MAAWFPYDLHILLITLLIVVRYYFKNAYRKFVESKIPFLEPWIPFGNITKSFLRLRHLVDDISEVYNKFSDHKYVAFFQFTKPVIMIRDPEMIKCITVKDFHYFVNHHAFVNEDIDELFGKGLFFLKGDKWKDMRSTLSPAFTGSKIKNMCGFMSDCGHQVIRFLMGEISKNIAENKQSITLDLKDLCYRFTSDVVATTAFGLKVDSFHEKDNEFYTVGRNTSNFNAVTALKFVGHVTIPKIMAFFNIRVFSEKNCNYYRNLVQSTMQRREKENIYRPDMIHLLMEAKKGTLKYEEEADGGTAGFATVEESTDYIGIVKKKWEDDDLTAQALVFFLAGFEATASMTCFVLYHIAADGEIQKKLQDEIDLSMEENGDDISYDIMKRLNYLDMVVSETLRIWSMPLGDRVCTKEYNLPPSKEGSNDGLKLQPDDVVCFPIYSIHHDPKYWPNPEKFVPERFSEENKGNIHPYTYLPFGAGPRNCIGSRFALMETKVMVYSLMSKFNMKLDETRTPVPLKLANDAFSFRPKNGFWMNFQARK